MEIRKYTKEDEDFLFKLLEEEGDEWIDYHGFSGRKRYTILLETNITYIALDNNIICGYIRGKEDNGFGVYIYDLLVRKLYRGGQIGKALIEQFQHDFPEQSIYIMSDVDIYYEKLGYRRIGSVFQI